MPLYHNLEINFKLISEEAIIDLTQFTGKRRGFRATLNKFNDLNIKFEIIGTTIF